MRRLSNQRSISPFDDASNRLFGAMLSGGGQLSDSRRKIIDLTIRRLKDRGIWDLIDILYVFAALDSVCALLNWKNPGTFTATLTNAPSFAADRGYTGNDTSALINSNYNPATNAISYALNSASVFGWNRTASPSGSSGLVGQIASFNTALILAFPTGTEVRVQINQAAGGNVDATPAAMDQLFSGNWDGTNGIIYRNGVQIGNLPRTSDTVASSNICFLTTSSLFGNEEIAAGGVGGSLTAGQHLELYGALLPYMQAVGAA